MVGLLIRTLVAALIQVALRWLALLFGLLLAILVNVLRRFPTTLYGRRRYGDPTHRFQLVIHGLHLLLSFLDLIVTPLTDGDDREDSIREAGQPVGVDLVEWVPNVPVQIRPAPCPKRILRHIARRARIVVAHEVIVKPRLDVEVLSLESKRIPYPIGRLRQNFTESAEFTHPGD